MKTIVANNDKEESAFEIVVRNRQRTFQFRTDVLRDFATKLVRDELNLERASLGIALLGVSPMAKANQQFLNHAGATDVITFAYPAQGEAQLSGELLICPAVAVDQSQEFGTSPASELVRYVVHGVLHLRGFDDLAPDLRRVMKKEENRLVRRLEQWLPFKNLEFKARSQ